MAIPMVPLRSSNLEGAAYDPTKKQLVVQFKGGTLYRYDGVPQNLYDGLLTAESAGRYFHANIKPAYRYEKIEES